MGALDLDQLRRLPVLSANAKTSVSLDFPVGHTCNPTPLCAKHCYAQGPTMTWPNSLRRRLRNLQYFRLAPTEEAVAKLEGEFRRTQRRWSTRTKLDFLRVNGSGDLFPEIVRVLNAFAIRNPDVRLWIVTRRFELAQDVQALPNVYLQLSLDSTTTPADEQRAREVMGANPRAYLSFLRTKPTDDTRGAAIVFNEKRTKGLPYVSSTDCPVDAGRLPLNNIRGTGGTACSRCRKCFSERTIERQRERVPSP